MEVFIRVCLNKYEKSAHIGSKSVNDLAGLTERQGYSIAFISLIFAVIQYALINLRVPMCEKK